MKLSEYEDRLQSDPEYIQAAEELKLHFSVANAVLRARVQKGWSQEQLAAAVGTKQANISRLEAGTANPTLTLLQRVFRVLELEVSIENRYAHAEQKIDVQPSPAGIPVRQNEVSHWLNTVCAPMYEVRVSAAQATEVLK